MLLQSQVLFPIVYTVSSVVLSQSSIFVCCLWWYGSSCSLIDLSAHINLTVWDHSVQFSSVSIGNSELRTGKSWEYFVSVMRHNYCHLAILHNMVLATHTHTHWHGYSLYLSHFYLYFYLLTHSPFPVPVPVPVTVTVTVPSPSPSSFRRMKETEAFKQFRESALSSQLSYLPNLSFTLRTKVNIFEKLILFGLRRER